MSKGHPVRCFDYVNHRYAQVRDALRVDPVGALSRATQSATARAEAVAVQLHVHLAGIEVGKDVDVRVVKIEELEAGTPSPVTRLQLEWKARESARLFPLMHAELSVYPLTGRETQLDLSGQYEPPLGILGGAVDAVVGHRIAEASIDRFVSEHQH